MRSWAVLCCFLALIGLVQCLNEEFIKKVNAGIVATKDRIGQISKQWDIEHYPAFLRTCSMHKTSLEVLKWKFMKKALEAHIHSKQEKFVVSFTGSSVTAGHDSHFNMTTTPEVGRLMREPFAALNIDFESRNVALGNNPCIPYDICVKTFAGLDADMVHWEQNYFCSGDALEFFIRQAMTIPTRPIVVFSSSSTGHWEPDKCAKGPHKITDSEKEALKADMLTLVSELNKEMYHGTWSDLVGKDKHYHGAAIQVFTHHGHEPYACLGPYIKTWMEGAASWHPSAIAHRLRASHHAYFWLQIWSMALQELHDVGTHRAVEAMLADVEHHLQANYPPTPPAMSVGPFIDNTTCYTDYRPRSIEENSLKARVVSGLVSENGEASSTQSGWKFVIYENLVDRNLVKRSLEMGYLDFKWLLYSKDNQTPLSLNLEISRAGPVIVCQTPGIWGKLPDGFSNLWDNKVDFYVTYNVPDKSSFSFDKKSAKKMKLYHDQAHLELCVQVMLADGSAVHPVGYHVLTIVPHDKANLIVAWLLTP